jgi:hypothetical protein
MSDSDKEEKIRKRAHAIWEEEGSPEGRHDEHWERAAREFDEQGGAASALEETLTETIGLAVGQEPARDRPDGRGLNESPAEGDRDTVQRELSRQDAAGTGKGARRKKSSGI